VRTPWRHVVTVTTSDGPGLFACYDSPGVPRPHHDREQLFGSHRYHERRSSGRRRASGSLVVRGSVRGGAAVATRMGPGADLDVPENYWENWRRGRADWESRREPGGNRGDSDAIRTPFSKFWKASVSS
jgi:hypothetical protein